MPLQAPILDSRTFEDIFNEARRRIPRYTREWTDFNESDPGITLVQLFAWLSEMMLVEMNRVPDLNFIKFLQLLNLELRPAQPAEAHVTFFPKPGSLFDPVPAGTQLAAQPAEGGTPLIFETEAGLDLIEVPLTDVQVFDNGGFTILTPLNEKTGDSFRPLGWAPQVGNAVYLGFTPPEVQGTGRLFPEQLRWRVFLPPPAKGGAAARSALSLRDVRQPPIPPVTLVWEYKPNDTARWRQLNVFSDETTAFTREGYIFIEGPAEITGSLVGAIKEPRLWLRVRLAEGGYPVGGAPEIDLIRPNTVPAINLTTVRGEILGVSAGTPGQTFDLENSPVFQDSLQLVTEIQGQPPEDWKRVDDFLASTPEARHYVLNHATGQIRFGDGQRGRIPDAGADLIARSYRYGGMAAGNVAAGMINSPLSTLSGVERVTNEVPAVGGSEEQDVEELKEQAPALIRSRNRAITAEDFTALAAQAGGVARATAIPLAHPDIPDVEVPGAVTIVIVPDTQDVPPVPSTDQKRHVLEYLDKFRLLTTELYVKEPNFFAIRVEAQVAARRYASFGKVTLDVEKALNDYLSPLRRVSNSAADEADPGKPKAEVKGWEFGRDLFPNNLFGVILNVQNVVAVLRLSLTVNGQPHPDFRQPVALPRDGLVYGAGHTIVVVPETDS